MTDTPPAGAQTPAHVKDSNAQTVVALAIVVGLVALGIGAIIAGLVNKELATTAFTVVGTAIGALATALNAPSGLATMITAARKPAGSA